MLPICVEKEFEQLPQNQLRSYTKGVARTNCAGHQVGEVDERAIIEIKSKLVELSQVDKKSKWKKEVVKKGVELSEKLVNCQDLSQLSHESS